MTLLSDSYLNPHISKSEIERLSVWSEANLI